MPDATLQERFDEVGRRIAELREDLRVFAPLVGQVGGLEADVEGLERSIEHLHADLRELHRQREQERKDHAAAIERVDKTANDVIRSGRIENLKLIGVLVGAFTTAVGTVLALFATGKL